jgi:hypothetical protein
MKLQWVRRSDYGQQPAGSEFQVTEVLPAEAPGLQGINGYVYVEGIYVKEGGVEKALYLELRKPVDYSRGQRGEPAKMQLFACRSVSEGMQNAFVSRGAIGQNFQPRRGQAGFVIRGRMPFEVDPSGYVWQEAHGGALLFYHMTVDGEVMTFKQWNKEGPVFVKDAAADGTWKQCRPANGQWQHEDVKEWADDIEIVDEC